MDSSEFNVSKRARYFPAMVVKGAEAIVRIQFEYQLFGGKVTTLSIGSALDSDNQRECVPHIQNLGTARYFWKVSSFYTSTVRLPLAAIH